MTNRTALLFSRTEPVIDTRTGRYAETDKLPAPGYRTRRYLEQSIERLCILADHPLTHDKAELCCLLEQVGFALPDWQRQCLAEWCG